MMPFADAMSLAAAVRQGETTAAAATAAALAQIEARNGQLNCFTTVIAAAAQQQAAAVDSAIAPAKTQAP